MAKITGKAASWTYKGTTIPFTKMTPSDTRTLAESTDSTNYDSASDMLWESQLAVKLAKEFKVEGRYDTTIVPTAVVADLYSGNAAGAVVIKLNPSVTLGHGNFDISDFEADIPVDDIVTYSCTLKLNGVWTAGS